MGKIKVIKPGYFTSVQDMGRYGYAHLGVPVAGAMDHFSLQLANHLLKNPGNAAGLEMSHKGPTLQFDEETQIILCGAEASILLNGHQKQLNRIIPIQKGDVLEIAEFKNGQWMYLAIRGGIMSEMILNSRSFFPGITHAKLRAGERLSYDRSPDVYPSHARLKPRIWENGTASIAVYPGPEIGHVDKDTFDQLFQRDYTVSFIQNRMGIFLNELLPNQMKEMLTSPVYPGTVQLTPSGKLILLMRDAQVTGGYPRILQLSKEAISLLSQKRPGQAVRFKLLEGG